MHVAARFISPDFGIQTFDVPMPTRKILLFSLTEW
jgi:hypothetical protein